MLATSTALILTMTVYLTFSQMAISYFGVNNIQQNIFENFSHDFDPLSQLLKVVFLVIFFCALPFNLHPLKICMLSLIEEFRSARISRELNARLGDTGQKASSKDDQIGDDYIKGNDDCIY